MKAAMQERDREKLEKVIEECEVASYPELGTELGYARDVLEEMGEGRGGQMSTVYFIFILLLVFRENKSNNS